MNRIMIDYITQLTADAHRKSMEPYNKFYYMLITFSGAAIVLSFTLLNTILTTHSGKVIMLNELIWSWIFLGTAILLSVVRIYVHITLLYELSMKKSLLEGLIKEYDNIAPEFEIEKKKVNEDLKYIREALEKECAKCSTQNSCGEFNKLNNVINNTIKQYEQIVERNDATFKRIVEKKNSLIKRIEEKIFGNFRNKLLFIFDVVIITVFFCGITDMLLFTIKNIKQ